MNYIKFYSAHYKNKQQIIFRNDISITAFDLIWKENRYSS